MWKSNVIQFHQIHFKLAWMFILHWLLLTIMIGCVSTSAVLLNRSPLSEKIWHYRPYRVAPGYLKLNPQRQIESHSFMNDGLRLPQKDAFRIEPSDAVVESKWSQPAVEPQYTSFLPTHGTQVPSTTTSFEDYFSPNAQTYLKSTNFQDSVIESTSEYADGSEKNFATNVYKNLDSEDHGSAVTEVTITSDYKVSDSNSSSNENVSNVHKRRGPVASFSQTKHRNRNNFTDTDDSHILVPSNSVFNYQSSHNASINVNMSKDVDSTSKQSNALAINANSSPSLGFTEQQTDNLLHSVYTTVSPESGIIENEAVHSTVFFETHSSSSFPVPAVSNYVSSTPDSVYNNENNVTSSLPSPSDVENNLSDALPSVGSTVPDRLTSGAVAGIVIAVLVCVTLLTSTVIYFLYRRYNGKCTSVVESKFNSDNCGYLDDSLRSSVYLNNHIELPKESSEEMTSLDNDSFLNSLETMTIQNYWADNTKNTKV